MASRYLVVGLCLVLSCGCSSTSKRHIVDRDPPRHEPSNVDREPADRPIRQVAYDDTDPADTNRKPSTDLSLSNSIAIALAQNPDLIAAREAENVGSAALGVAQTYPFNPFVQVQATPYQDARFGGPGTTYHYVLLMQTIQLAHQQQFREDAGTAMLNTTRWNILQAELQNVAQTERLYFTYLYLRGLQDLAVISNANNQELLRTLEKQLEAGQATAADVAMVRIDARSTQQQLRLARANAESALRDLKRQLGLSAEDPTTFSGDLRTFQWQSMAGTVLEPKAFEIEVPVTSAEGRERMLVASRAASRPDVMAAHSDVDVARANLSLATASKTPDLQIGPYYQRTLDGTNFLGFRAQMDLPVINTGRPLEQQRCAELTQRLTMWQQAMRRAELEATAAWERYKLASEAVAEDTAFRQTDLPNELQRLEEQFVAGEVDVVRVMQARTSIIQNQRVRLDLLNELAQAAANVTATTGIAVEELLQE